MECLGPKNRKLWRIEELHLRQELGIKTLDDSTLAELKSQKPHSKLIRTTYNYEIQSNPKYAAMFQYTPVDMRDTQEEKSASDMVLKILYLAYFTINQRKYYIIISFIE